MATCIGLVTTPHDFRANLKAAYDLLRSIQDPFGDIKQIARFTRRDYFNSGTLTRYTVWPTPAGCSEM